jgi:hypothetical protein
MTAQTFIKSLVIRDDAQQLEDLADRLRVARDLGLRTFQQNGFRILDILGRFSYGYIAVYEFEKRGNE